MSYGTWIRSKEKKSTDFSEKAYSRESMAIWDAKWHRLSVQARYFFLFVVKSPGKNRLPKSKPTGVSAARFPAAVLKELTAAGFVELITARSRAFDDQVIACDGLYDFATRLRAMHSYHLLDPEKSSEFRKYLDYIFVGSKLLGVLSSVLRHHQIFNELSLAEIIKAYVVHQRWPGWVAGALKEPLAEQILDVIRQAEGPVPLVALLGQIPGSDPAKVRKVVDALITHLALVEDLEPKTWDVMVGLVPKVREQWIQFNQPYNRAPLVACERTKEVGPSGSVIADDLRSVLLEIASDPPRVRQDQALYTKEIERFQAVQEPLPAWLLKAMKWSDASRVGQAIGLARALQLVKDVAEGKQIRLHLNAKGHKWLSSDLEEQYQGIYKLFTAKAERNSVLDPHMGIFCSSFDPFNDLGAGDTRFLGAHVTVLRLEKGKRVPYHWDTKVVDHQALRTSLDEAFAALKPGIFYRLDSVKSHLVDREHNPLNRGLDPDQVVVYWHSRLIPPRDEPREEAGRLVIETFVRQRLIPLGCVRVAIDDEDRICIAREPRYDAYFDRPVALEDWAPNMGVAARVVVQPDFSVIVIGLNPAPAAELAPFCERSSSGSGQGALVLKITRDSIVKAVGLGLKPEEIINRLKRHASNDVPLNVLREVEEWSNWVRRVTTSTLTVLRCPDQETADRVVSALKRLTERISNTIVAVDLKKLTAVEQGKLRNYGIILQKGTEAKASKTKSKKQTW
ncbi:Helicase conserved C-terminal domain-containing protein [Singulisphaera sp. GP187]|uniref:helicase-associated domain-containing protein n=1 Tax=Singulisphaera sp. GP187 TaxID=1882752 RepID=UPI0009293231|nr:helicase-associated domain-containing protein [Singulisphaera sp. GP187]SIO67897.1 Helicase conserved C-terminal domain-containing protein [Singulisphaera sp. GP187]